MSGQLGGGGGRGTYSGLGRREKQLFGIYAGVRRYACMCAYVCMYVHYSLIHYCTALLYCTVLYRIALDCSVLSPKQ